MVLQKRSLLLVTGASRGLGREVAVQLGAALGAGSVAVLVARSAAGLAETAAAVAASAPHLTVLQKVYDLSASEDSGLAGLVSAGLAAAGDEPLQAAICVHNAATLGDPSCTALQLESVCDMDRYLHMNVTSCVVLNSAFVRLVRPRVSGGDASITLVNMSSLCALQPIRMLSLYCIGKAAREMVFNSVAAEVPSLRVLSYAPGPVVTKMAHQIAENSADPEVKQTYQDGVRGGFNECSVTVRRLVRILEADKFKTGAHVDFFDPE